MEDLEKKSSQTETERRRRNKTKEENIEFLSEDKQRRPSVIDLISGNNKKEQDKGNSSSGANLNEAAAITKGLVSMYNPSSYLNDQTKNFIGNILKTPEISRTNKRQKEIDVAADDVSRVTELQRLLLTDPIIGEADPDTVVNLYNTLSKANPEIVKDKNLLRFALREALQYDAVPLHTYKDLISMGKDRASMQETMQKLEKEKYSI